MFCIVFPNSFCLECVKFLESVGLIVFTKFRRLLTFFFKSFYASFFGGGVQLHVYDSLILFHSSWRCFSLLVQQPHFWYFALQIPATSSFQNSSLHCLNSARLWAKLCLVLPSLHYALRNPQNSFQEVIGQE